LGPDIERAVRANACADECHYHVTGTSDFVVIVIAEWLRIPDDQMPKFAGVELKAPLN